MNPFCMPLRRKRSLAVRLTLLRGVLRRLYLNLLRPRYVRESLARRQGMCLRCGACCYLVANRCARLIIDPDSGQTSCWRYDRLRAPNCKTFPIDARDLADRNLIAPETRCGYSWPEETTATPPASRES